MNQISHRTCRWGLTTVVLAGSLAVVGPVSAAAGPVPRVRPCLSHAGKTPSPARTVRACELAALARRMGTHRVPGPANANVVRTDSRRARDAAPVIAPGFAIVLLAVGGPVLTAEPRP